MLPRNYSAALMELFTYSRRHFELVVQAVRGQNRLILENKDSCQSVGLHVGLLVWLIAKSVASHLICDIKEQEVNKLYKL